MKAQAEMIFALATGKNNPATGSQNTETMIAVVPTSNAVEYRSWQKAVRATIFQTLAKFS